MKCLPTLIESCISLKTGNKEFALFYLGDEWWRAMIGCRYQGMMLGESPGEIEAEGSCAEEAVERLFQAIQEKQK